KYRIVMNRQLQVSLVVERHRGQLTESVLAVEHPTVGARQQRVGDVANALLDWGPRLGARPRALNPLTLQIVRNLATEERAVPCVLNREGRSPNQARGIGKSDALRDSRAW